MMSPLLQAPSHFWNKPKNLTNLCVKKPLGRHASYIISHLSYTSIATFAPTCSKAF